MCTDFINNLHNKTELFVAIGDFGNFKRASVFTIKLSTLAAYERMSYYSTVRLPGQNNVRTGKFSCISAADE